MLEADLWLHFGSYVFGMEVLLVRCSPERVLFEVESHQSHSPEDVETFLKLVKDRAADLLHSELRVFLAEAERHRLSLSKERLVLTTPLCPLLASEERKATDLTELRGVPGHRPEHGRQSLHFALENLRTLDPDDNRAWQLLCEGV